MYEWFKSLTGAWGPPLLDWYLSHSWINIPILLYGMAVLLAWRSYDQVEQRLVDDLLAGNQRKRGKNHIPDEPAITWDEAISGLSFPFIARRGQLLIHRLTARNAERLIDLRVVRTRAQAKVDIFNN